MSVLLPEMHADLFSRHVRPSEGTNFFLLWRSTEKIGGSTDLSVVQIVVYLVPGTSY